MYQWQEVELETGLTQLSFPLTSDPIQGSYKIVVQKSLSSYVEHSFSVEEYGKERKYWQQRFLLCCLSLGFPADVMEKTRTEYVGNGVQRG